MLISVTEARKAPGQTFAFSFEKAGFVMELGAKAALSKPVSVYGNIVADAEGISVRGGLKTAFTTECARCLKPIEEPLDAEFDVRFQKSGESDDDEVYSYEGDSLDITEMVKDFVLLAVPIRSLCDDACKGLCEICGANLNEGACAHRG